jgi:hypothetical protein
MFAGESRIDLAASALAKLLADVLNEPVLFGVDTIARQIRRSGDQEWHQALSLRVEGLAPDIPDPEGVIGIEKQPMEHEAHQAPIPAIGLQRLANVLLDLSIGLSETAVHIDGKHAFFVRRQVVGNVLKRDEHRGAHQEFAEEERRCARSPHKANIAFGGTGACVVRVRDPLDRFEDPVSRLEIAFALTACLESFFDHPPRFHAEENVEEIVGVPAHHCSCGADELPPAAPQHIEVVALRRVIRKLMQFVGDRVVEESLHVAADILERRHALDLVAVRFPECRVHLGAALRTGEALRELYVLEVLPR